MGFDLLEVAAERLYPDFSKMYVREAFYVLFLVYGVLYFIAKSKGGEGYWETASRVVGALLVVALLVVVYFSMFGY